jgi:hypothetical protein
MTAAQFKAFWANNFPDLVLLQYLFKYEYAEKWFRIHSLPESKRYAEDDSEWAILLGRQNEIISDLLDANSDFLLVTGDYTMEGFIELHPPEEIHSIADFTFISLDQINLNEISPDIYGPGQFCTPRFSEQKWETGKFDNLLKDIADDNLRAFFVSFDKQLIIAPYDGGVDFILKDTKTRDQYKQKYSSWLSEREDGF